MRKQNLSYSIALTSPLKFLTGSSNLPCPKQILIHFPPTKCIPLIGSPLSDNGITILPVDIVVFDPLSYLLHSQSVSNSQRQYLHDIIRVHTSPTSPATTLMLAIIISFGQLQQPPNCSPCFYPCSSTPVYIPQSYLLKT